MLLPIEARVLERHAHEVPDRIARAGGDDVVRRLIRLEHPPHRIGVLGGITPVAAGVEIAEVEHVLEARGDPRHGHRDLARHEGLTAAR